jgi:hypothetical protein
VKLSDVKHLSWYREQERGPGLFVRVKTENPLNSRKEWVIVWQVGKRVKAAVSAVIANRIPRTLPITFTLTRYSSGKGFDRHDALPASCKHVVDAIAAEIGVDDANPAVVWKYQQATCPRGCYGIRIEWSAVA